jgi:hypothetical protein
MCLLSAGVAGDPGLGVVISLRRALRGWRAVGSQCKGAVSLARSAHRLAELVRAGRR